MEEFLRNVDLDEPTSFLDHVYLEWTRRECKPNEIIVEQYKKMFASRMSAGATEKLPGWVVVLVLRHGRTCSKMRGEMLRARKQTEQLYEVSSPCLDDHHFQKEELEQIEELSVVLLTNSLEILVLGTNW